MIHFRTEPSGAPRIARATMSAARAAAADARLRLIAATAAADRADALEAHYSSASYTAAEVYERYAVQLARAVVRSNSRPHCRPQGGSVLRRLWALRTK